jgi:hypothetical protein
LPRPVPEADLAIMRRLDRLHLELPFAGSRMLRGLLAAEGCIGSQHNAQRVCWRGVLPIHDYEFHVPPPSVTGASSTAIIGAMSVTAS